MVQLNMPTSMDEKKKKSFHYTIENITIDKNQIQLLSS